MFRVESEFISPFVITLLNEMIVGWKVADMIVTLGSLDFNMGEVDR